MRAFLAAVLSVIAVGVLLIAYGLFNPRTATADGYYPLARPMLANERVAPIDNAYATYNPYAPAAAYNYPNGTAYNNPYAPAYATVGRPAVTYPVSDVRAVPAYETYPAPRVVTRTVRTPVRVVERRRGRDWTKTALVIGGSTATGAGVGAIFGGKKGALIGAAIGGGASTLWEAKKR